MQHGLHPPAQFLVLAGHHGGGQRVFGDLAGQIGAGQHADTGLRGDLLENLAHQQEALGLDAFGQADQQFAGQLRGMGLQGRPQGAGRQRDEDQLAARQGRRQVGQRLDAGVNLHPLQVARVLAGRADRLGLCGVAHPEVHPVAVLRQQIGDRRAETAAPEDGDGLLFSHKKSVVWRLPALYGAPSDRPVLAREILKLLIIRHNSRRKALPGGTIASRPAFLPARN
ncbi:hypothetical protein D9M70_362120 [compost metagenome]